LKKLIIALHLLLSFMLVINSCIKENDFPAPKTIYPGLHLPGKKPQVFAPGIVNTEDKIHSCVAIAPDGKEIYWSRFSTISGISQERIWFIKFEDGTWTQPGLAPFSSEYREGGPRFSHNGKRLFFTSCKPKHKNDETTDANIWFVEKTEDGWKAPIQLDSKINTEFQEWFPTIAKSGNIYYMFRGEEKNRLWDIYCSKFANGKYSEPIKLGEEINTQYVDAFPFIDPDEKFLIFYSEKPGGFCEHGELYISFKEKDGGWTNAKNLGKHINRSFTRFPGISPDRNFFFFSNLKDEKEILYWADKSIIDKTQGVEKFNF